MNIFRFELKKLWNWRTLCLIAVLCVLTWFAFLSEFQSSYESMLSHGIYGSYQTELYRQYGVTLELEELTDFDISNQKVALVKKMDNMIANNLIFSENGIHSYAEFHAFEQDETAKNTLGDQYYNTLFIMQGILEQEKEGQTLDEWYDSPLMRYTSLLALEDRYVNFDEQLQPLLHTKSNQPIVMKTVEKLMQTKNANLIPYFLSYDFSLYAAVIGVVALLSTLFFVAPLVVTDRSQNIHMLQYTASIGRRVLQRQFAATVLSAFLLATIIVTLAYFALFSAFIDDYWSAPIMAFDGSFEMQLYDITFGNYALLLAGISIVFCVGMAGVAFLLARFSANIVTMLIKIVPTCGLSALIMALSLSGAMSYSWLYPNIFRGKIDIPEVWIACFIALIGILLSSVMIHREKHVDVV